MSDAYMWGVYLHSDRHDIPSLPLALFQYGDQATRWSSQNYPNRSNIRQTLLVDLVASPPAAPRRFNLVRKEDATGISGTGIVAEGVVFSDWTVAMRWKTDKRSTALYDCVEDVEAIHGHGGKTVIEWVD